VDLFVGAEGTLGVVTHVLLRTVATRDVALAFVPLRDEAAALRLADDLRRAARETWQAQDGLGLDVAAIESLDGRCLDVLREDGLGRHLGRAGYALLIQLDLPPGENAERTDELAGALDDDATDGPLARLVRLLVTHDALDDAQIALPGEPFGAELLKLRERVPEGVNRRVGLAGATKTAGDAIVPFDRLGEWLARLRADFAHAGLDLAVWGHLSDGNLHPNLVPRTPDDVPAATELLVRAARHAIELGGAPLAEHGVGKSPLKQGLLRDFYGESGVEAMRQVKRALDPHGQLSPGNLFAPEPDRP
jgi:D-lactate dehydrogenase (cytochrome)